MNDKRHNNAILDFILYFQMYKGSPKSNDRFDIISLNLYKTIAKLY